MRLKVAVLAAFSLVATLTQLQPADAAVPVLKLDCGQTIGDDVGEPLSFKLGNDLSCPGAGITLGADDMTIDLGGHLLVGSAVSSGVSTSFARSTIRNGVIDGFDEGVTVHPTGEDAVVEDIVVVRGYRGVSVAGPDAQIRRATLINNSNAGATFFVDGEAGSVSNSTITGGGVGVSFESVAGGTVVRNRIIGTENGIYLGTEADNTTMTRNTILLSKFPGIDVGPTAGGNTISRNTIKGGNNNGIEMQGDSNTVSKNSITANLVVGIHIAGNNNTFSGNNVSKNLSDGIKSDVALTGNVITGNTVNENGDNGMFIPTPTVITRNTANFNGYGDGSNGAIGHGIDAGGSSGAGNKAKGNDNEQNCFLAPGSTCAIASTAPPPLLTCSSNISGNVTVRNPLMCAADGLEFTASNVTFNLNGHRLDGSGTGQGVGANDGPERVTVRNGVITDFNVGVQLSQSDGGTVRDLLMSGDQTAIHASDSVGVKTTRNTIVQSSGTAIDYEQPAPPDAIRGSISGNTLVGVANNGILVHNDADKVAVRSNTIYSFNAAINLGFAKRTSVTRNRIIGNDNGVHLGDSIQNAVSGNTLIGSSNNGIHLEDSSNDNTVSSNRVSANANGIRTDGSQDNTFVRNTVFANQGAGIDVSGLQTTVVRNVVNDNGNNGILTDANTTVSKNTANNNGHLNNDGGTDGLGIDSSGTLGTGNKAKDNDDPLQCIPTGPPFCV